MHAHSSEIQRRRRSRPDDLSPRCAVADDALTPSLRQRVYGLVAQVPYGRVTTYGALARALGEPRRAREVGWAMASTPDTLDIPAHRVINSRGHLSGAFAFGGYEVHRAILLEEGVPFLEDGRVDLAACAWSPPGQEQD